MTDRMGAAGFVVIGLILKRLNLSVVPIIPSIDLGNIMEVKLRSAMMRVKTTFNFVERPIAAIIALMILMIIVRNIRTLILEHRARLIKVERDHNLHNTRQR